MELDKEQKKIADAIIRDSKTKWEVSLSGFGGTGKSTIVRYLKDKLRGYAVCAFTGKATNVLRKKGILDAQTIHSLIYTPVPLENGQVRFEPKASVDCEGFIVDEASMLSDDLYRDMKKYFKTIIFVGDHGQLEPVGGNPNVMKNPDYRLEKVHRNAGEIAHFAEWIRLGKNPEEFKTEHKVQFVPAYHKKMLLESKNVVSKVDQMICAYNATRVEINAKVRVFFNFTNKVELNERVMCLRNNKKYGLFNGMQGIVTQLRKGNVFDIETDCGRFEKVSYHPDVFGKERIDPDLDLEGTNPFDYAYCVTAHKSQGDEWNAVLVIEQICKNWDHKRWAYTAASRAREQLIWVGAYRKNINEQETMNEWF